MWRSWSETWRLEHRCVLTQDTANAKALKVAQTPTFYVNGKRLREHGADELRALVRSEIQAQYK